MAIQTVDTLDELRRQRDAIMALARQHRARRIEVFGSLLRGTLGASSDIDFLVDFEPDYSLRDHIRLVQGLRDLLGRPVDVVDREALRPELRDAILREAQVL